MDKKTAAATVDNDTSVEVRTELLQGLMTPPRVYAYEVAAEVGCSESALSKYLNRGRPLPHGIGLQSVRRAIARIRARKQAAA